MHQIPVRAAFMRYTPGGPSGFLTAQEVVERFRGHVAMPYRKRPSAKARLTQFFGEVRANLFDQLKDGRWASHDIFSRITRFCFQNVLSFFVTR